MADSALTEAERRLFEELNARGVRFLIVGASAAVLQGANMATQDVHLWFESTVDPSHWYTARPRRNCLLLKEKRLLR